MEELEDGLIMASQDQQKTHEMLKEKEKEKNRF